MEKKLEWYLPDPSGTGTLGPFGHDEIVAQVKAGVLTLDAFVWGPHMPVDKWARAYELPEFAGLLSDQPKCPVPKRSRGSAKQKSAVLDFTGTQGEYGIENEYRRFPRAPMSCAAVIHNQKTFLKCEVVDISEKGVSIKAEENLVFKAGEEITITLLDTSFAGTFSLKTTVMRSLDRPRGYGLYFLTINPQIKRKVAQYVIASLEGAPRERGAA